MTQYGSGIRYGGSQFGEWQWEHSIDDIGQAMVTMLARVQGIENTLDHDPTTAEIASVRLPVTAVTYKGFHLDKQGIQHEWLVPVFFDASPERAETTEKKIKEVATGIFNAFMSDQALGGTCVNAFPVEGKTDYLTKGRKLLFSVLLLTVETLVVRR